MRRFGTIVLVLFLGIAISGCAASKKKGGGVEVEDATIGGSSGTDASSSGIGTGDSAEGSVIIVEPNPNDMDDPLGQRVVYFDFDSANLTPEEIGRAHV